MVLGIVEDRGPENYRLNIFARQVTHWVIKFLSQAIT